MKRFITALFFTFSLLITTNIVKAANTSSDHKLYGKRANQTEARELALNFIDGTNIMLVNWSHYAVDVDVPLLGESVDLGPITTEYNAYYLYSPFYYSYVSIYLYDAFTGLHIATVAADNPSTVEIWDSYFAETNQEKGQAKERITLKKGL